VRGGSPWLVLEGVGYRYGGDLALAAVDLALGAGERLVLLGPNGGGKTTLLRLLLGLAEPTAGRIVRARPGLSAGYVPQFPAFDRDFPLRVREVIADGALRDHAGGNGGAAFERLVDRLGLRSLLGAYLTELSGGELKRALVARALVGRPDLLVLDEPTASLDAAARAALWALVEELPAEASVVLATHDLAPATFRPTRALRVDRGVAELALDDLHEPALLCGHGD
jgi:zinc transport system ATP-binding protein